MRKVAILAGLLMLLAGPRVASAIDRWVVDPGNPCSAADPPIYVSIQAAVDDSIPGDVIHVCPGTYLEVVLVDVSNLSILAEGTVVMTPPFPGGLPAFDVVSDDVTIQGFELTGFGGVFRLVANRATIQFNDIHDNDTSIVVGFSGNRIRSNHISNTSEAISAPGVEGLEVVGNTISAATVGMAIFGSDPTTKIDHNLVTGGGDGILVSDCVGTVISNNTVRGNEGMGIKVSSCAPVSSADEGAVVRKNLVQRNDHGIVVENSINCYVGFNSVSFNGLRLGAPGHGIELTTIDGCTIERNNASRNNPPDCVWDGLGSNTFSGNSCKTEDPPGAWD